MTPQEAKIRYAKLLYGDRYRPGYENRWDNEVLNIPPEIIPTDEERARILQLRKPGEVGDSGLS